MHRSGCIYKGFDIHAALTANVAVCSAITLPVSKIREKLIVNNLNSAVWYLLINYKSSTKK